MLMCMCSQPAPPGRVDATVPNTSAVAGPRVTLPDGQVFHVELATDDATRAQGLMYRDRLRPNTGMLFIFQTAGDQAFWMKNTLIPLDMIFIDVDGRVTHVAHDVQPCRADPCPSYPTNPVRALYVLELAAGMARQHGVEAGKTLRIEGIENVVIR